MKNNPFIEYIHGRSRITVDLDIPKIAIGDDWNLWAQALLAQEHWCNQDQVLGADLPGRAEHQYLQSFLHTFRLLLELGRLPVFDVPNFVSLSKRDQGPKEYRLEIELFLVRFVPAAAYNIPLNVSLDLCVWMTRHRPSSENKATLFEWITKKVVGPLQKIVPAGKSTIPVLRVAHRRGIPFEHLGMGVYQLGWGSKARRLDRSICELDSAIGAQLSQNKVSTANILRAAGLPAPVHGVVTKEEDARGIAAKIGYPVVVKPTDRDRGEGVTVGITDEAGLKTAFTHAVNLSNSKQVIVERQVSGVCHRLFMVKAKLLYAVARHPIAVRADGERNIRQLVDDEISRESEKPPWSRSEIRAIDDLALQVLASKGLTPDSIPPKGMTVPLRRIESTEWGGVDEEVTNVVHPENIEIAGRAVQLFGLHIAGVDIISPDITKPWRENGAIINEVNFAPLFGGAEISKSYIPTFFSEFIEGDGKIPIEFFQSLSDALSFQEKMRKNGQLCYVLDSDRTLDPAGINVTMALTDMKRRARALILRSDVDAIAVVM